jgi:hypothetical protein
MAKKQSDKAGLNGLNDLALVGGGGTASLHGFTLSRTGLREGENLTLEQWKAMGEWLRHCDGAVHWWIGDWLNCGERNWAEMYQQAVEATGFDYQTLRDDKWVCGRVEMSRRRDKLSFSHHKEVAALLPDAQDRFLAHCELEGWSTRELRQQIARCRVAPEITAGKDGKSYPSGAHPCAPETPADAPDEPETTREPIADDWRVPEGHEQTNGYHVDESADDGPPDEGLPFDPDDIPAEPEAPTPATRAKKPKPVQEEVRDALGRTVPANLRDVFADQTLPREVERIRGLLRQIEFEGSYRLLARVRSAFPWAEPKTARDMLEEAYDSIRAAAEHVEMNLPYAVCPACEGTGKEDASHCKLCRQGCGYLPKWRYEQARLEGAAP